ncbi:MAG: glycosyltransferase [Ignavibacteriae bacterium]|nr:glycosyltransferase [Ignavibacteriota bacterium]
MLRFSDRYIVQSKIVLKDLLSLKPKAVYKLVPHPIYSGFGDAMGKDAARKQLGITESRVLLFFGYIRRYKGLHILLEAFAAMPQDVPTRLLVVGEFYGGEEEYRAKIDQLGLQDRITLVGRYVPNEEIPAFFSAADAVVLPYLSATERHFPDRVPFRDAARDHRCGRTLGGGGERRARDDRGTGRSPGAHRHA